MPKQKSTKKSASRRQALPKASLSEAAYEALRERVLNLTLPVGELLNERWIYERLGFGRTPVHQALQRLHQEGFLEIVPRKGVLVKPDSVSRIIDLLDARSIIEPVLAGRAARRAGPDDIKALKQITAPLSEPADRKSSSVDRFIERDRAFHAKLAAARY
jgi:DNA-binding GntR family transcriptional regulator